MAIRPHCFDRLSTTPSPLPKGEGVRPANIKDAEGIATVHVKAWQETYRRLMPDSVLDTLSVERRTKQWEHILEDTATQHKDYVAEHNGKITGFASCGTEREGDSDYQGELYALYILKEFHGQGLGRMLIQKSAEGLLSMGISSMLLWVLAGNPAQKFYEHLGGVYLREGSFEIGESALLKRAYGWKDIRLLAGIGLG
jgi:ribosomal protein S18 acetylase RimI-like enzyme